MNGSMTASEHKHFEYLKRKHPGYDSLKTAGRGLCDFLFIPPPDSRLPVIWYESKCGDDSLRESQIEFAASNCENSEVYVIWSESAGDDSEIYTFHFDEYLRIEAYEINQPKERQQRKMLPGNRARNTQQNYRRMVGHVVLALKALAPAPVSNAQIDAWIKENTTDWSDTDFSQLRASTITCFRLQAIALVSGSKRGPWVSTDALKALPQLTEKALTELHDKCAAAYYADLEERKAAKQEQF